MKKDTHPHYQDVLFIDSSNGTKFVIGSTIQTKEKEKHEGVEYPVHRVSVSSASHPFYTKANDFIDSEGRVDKFRKKYQRKKEEEQARQEKQKEQEKEKIVKRKKK